QLFSGAKSAVQFSVASSGQRSIFSNHNLRLARRRVSQGWFRRQLSRSFLRRSPERWTAPRTLVGRPPPEAGVEGALKHPSPSLRMEEAPRNRLPQLRLRHAWSQKWLIRYFRKRSFCPPAFALGLRPAPGFPPSIAWNSISTSSDLIAVFIAVYGFLIFGLVSTADTHFIRASHCQCSVASPALASVLHFAHPSEQHRWR